MAAHDASDIVRLTLAVKEEPSRVVVRHLWTMAIPVDEIPDYLEVVAHTERFVTGSLNKYVDHLQRSTGKAIELE